MAYDTKNFKYKGYGSSVLVHNANYDTTKSSAILCKFQILVLTHPDPILEDDALNDRGMTVEQSGCTGVILHCGRGSKRILVGNVSGGSGAFTAGTIVVEGENYTVSSVAVPPINIQSVFGTVNSGTVSLGFGGGTPYWAMSLSHSFEYGKNGTNFCLTNQAGTPDGSVIINTETDWGGSGDGSYNIFVQIGYGELGF